jgi:hypothetical protein
VGTPNKSGRYGDPASNSPAFPENFLKIRAHQRLAKANKTLLAQLARQPFFAIRLGGLKFRGWGVPERHLPANEPAVTLTADYLQPNIQQKGVDMRIGLDSKRPLALHGHRLAATPPDRIEVPSPLYGFPCGALRTRFFSARHSLLLEELHVESGKDLPVRLTRTAIGD